MDVNRSSLQRSARRDAVSSGSDRIAIDEFLQITTDVVIGNAPEMLAIEAKDKCPLGLTEPDGVLRYCIEHRLQIESGAADYPEHLACGDLLLQRFAEVGGALVQLVEEPPVLDGDDGLIGKGFNQRDLAGGEGAHLVTVDHEYANQLVRLV